MQFIGHLESTDRERLIAAGDVVCVPAGTHLLRRGEGGGDIYLIESGRIEIVDCRQNPEVVLDILGPGRVVGEMAFVDESPRAADVRAVEDCTVRHWPRTVLLKMLEGDVGLSARFYTALSRAAVSRLRATDKLAAGVVHARSLGVASELSAAAAVEARALASAPRAAWAAAEDALRGGTQVESLDIDEVLSALVEAVDVWLSGVTSVSRAQNAGAVLRSELRHWLLRSQTGHIAVERREEQGGRLSFLAHLLLNRAQGTDVLGEHIDGAILALPTPRGLRQRLMVAVDEVGNALPTDRPANITLIQPACGALLARMLPRVVAQGATIQCVDSDAQTLAFVDTGLQALPANVSLEMVHQDLVDLSENRVTQTHGPADLIVLNGLVDHLPSGLISSLLLGCAAQLAEGGRMVLTAMAPATDARFMEHLLGWPLMRRTAEELVALVSAAGLEARVSMPDSGQAGCGFVIVASVSVNGQR
jgi:CRP-like cAMP-binding protein